MFQNVYTAFVSTSSWWQSQYIWSEVNAAHQFIKTKSR